MAGERLPSRFYEEMDIYLGAYKKKFAQARKKGDVDEYSTDPIPLPVYRLLLRRSIETNNIFTWTWMLLQWNCMARSALIDCLAFHNFTLGLDSLVVKYDETKADKSGEKLSEKNVYANPIDWTMCTWLGLGIYCCVFQGNLLESERLFLKKGTKEGAGSTKYHEQVVGLVRGMESLISPHMKVGKVSAVSYFLFFLKKKSSHHVCLSSKVKSLRFKKRCGDPCSFRDNGRSIDSINSTKRRVEYRQRIGCLLAFWVGWRSLSWTDPLWPRPQ